MPKGKLNPVAGVTPPQLTRRGLPRKNQSPGAGRPHQYTPALGKKIADALRLGATLELAGAAAGIHFNTIHNWYNEGLEGKTPELARFPALVEQARAEFVLSGLQRLHDAAKGDARKKIRPNWLADAWLLERTLPGQPYAIQKQRIEVEDVSVKEAATRMTMVEARVIEEKKDQLALEHHEGEDEAEDEPE